MNNTVVWVVVALVVIIGGFWLINNSSAPAAGDMGTYAYACDNGSEFTMTPASDMSSIEISAGSQGMFTGTATLTAVGSSGQRFEGNGIVFVGAGEGVQLTVGSETTNCNPVPNMESPPWNWGDAGEGGGE